MKNILLIITMLSFAAAAIAEEKPESNVSYQDEVIHIFPGKPENGLVVEEQMGDKRLWVNAVRKGGRTRQVRITCREQGPGAVTEVQFRYPFGEASASWNMDVKRDGDVVTAPIRWNATLIGDIMDVNEGQDNAEAARKKLGLIDPDSKLPVMFSCGDSISVGYWPYLEAELFEDVNVYYLRELAKDMPEITMTGIGSAKQAYAIMQEVYKNEAFRPDYWLVNFGLHMVGAYASDLPGYRQWLEKFADLAKEKNVVLLFVTTTPTKRARRRDSNGTIVKFNDLVKQVARERHFHVVDLHAFCMAGIKESGNKVYGPDRVHFNQAFKKKQGAFIAKRVREIIDSAGPESE